jgi:hypothetical protein
MTLADWQVFAIATGIVASIIGSAIGATYRITQKITKVETQIDDLKDKFKTTDEHVTYMYRLAYEESRKAVPEVRHNLASRRISKSEEEEQKED